MTTFVGGLIVAAILISLHFLLREFTIIKKFDDKLSKKEQSILKRYIKKYIKRGKHC